MLVFLFVFHHSQRARTSGASPGLRLASLAAERGPQAKGLREAGRLGGVSQGRG